MKTNFLTKGNNHFNAGNYKQAQIEYRRVLAEDPENIFARVKLARCYLGLGEIDNAITEATMVMEKDKLSIEAYYVLGVAFSEKKEFENGKKLLDQALLINPSSSLIYHGLGIISFDRKNLDESIDLFNKALQLEPKYWRSNLFLSEVYKLKGDFKRALEHSLKVFKTMSTKHNFYQLLVAICLQYSLYLRTANLILLAFLLFSKSIFLIPGAVLSVGITSLISSIFLKRGDRALGIVVIILGISPICWYLFRIIW